MYIKKSNQRLFFSNSRKNYNAQHCHLLHCFFFLDLRAFMEQRGYDAQPGCARKFLIPNRVIPHPVRVFALKVSKMYDERMVDTVIINRVMNNSTQ